MEWCIGAVLRSTLSDFECDLKVQQIKQRQSKWETELVDLNHTALHSYQRWTSFKMAKSCRIGVTEVFIPEEFERNERTLGTATIHPNASILVKQWHSAFEGTERPLQMAERTAGTTESGWPWLQRIPSTPQCSPSKSAQWKLKLMLDNELKPLQTHKHEILEIYYLSTGL